MRKVIVTIEHRVILHCEDGCDIESAINELNVDFQSNWEGATVADTEMTGSSVTSNKPFKPFKQYGP